MQSTKTLPDGRKVYAYDEATRKKAKRIFIISMIVFVLAVLGKVTSVFEFLTNISIFDRPIIPAN